jgi:SNF2 family DNA or RNA helicase
MIKTASAIQPTEVISGPGVSALANMVQKMLSEINPTTNGDALKADDNAFFHRWRNEYDTSGIRYAFIDNAIKRLFYYQNPYLPEYQSVYNMISTDYDNHLQFGQRYEDQDNSTVEFLGKNKYKRNMIKVPNLGQRSDLVSSITSLVDDIMRYKNVQEETWRTGSGIPVFKHYQQDGYRPDVLELSDLVLNEVLSLLKDNGYDTSGASQGTSDEGKVSNKILFNGVEFVAGNQSYIVKIPMDSNIVRQQMYDNNVSYTSMRPLSGDDKYTTVSIPIRSANEDFNSAYNMLKNNYDTSQLDAYLTHEQSNEENQDGLKYIQVQDSSHPNLQLQLRTDAENYKEFKELVQFSFPLKAKSKSLEVDDNGNVKNVMRYQLEDKGGKNGKNGNNGIFDVGGSFSDWKSFISLLKSEGYNTNTITPRLNEMRQSGEIKKGRVEGKLDGYATKIEGVDYPEGIPVSYVNFSMDLNKDIANGQIGKSKSKTIELHAPQVYGASFLYGRNSAILGDEPGVGKTFQIISAMSMRLKNNGGNGLIITISATTDQIKKEIINLLGEDEADQISLEPLEPKKWTIAYYEQFSSGGEMQNRIDALINANLTAVALDEIHRVKNEDSKKSKNISKITKNVPFVWGASATIASNSPEDVYNQLKITNHRLGKMEIGEFKKAFVGSPKNAESRTLAATNLSKWLRKSKVYLRRTKKDIREDIPDLNVSDIAVTANNMELEKSIRERVSKYKDSDNPLSLLSAARVEIANSKSSMSVDKAMNFVRQDEKVLIFSNFKNAASNIFSKMQEACDIYNQEENKNYYAISFLGDDSKDQRKENEITFKTDPNCIALVISAKIGGTGVDFPNIASHVVMNDFDWTPASATQSEARTHRISSENESNIYYMIAENTIDRKLYDKVQLKRRISSIVENIEKALSKKRTSEDEKKFIKRMKELREADDKLKAQLDKENAQYLGQFIDPQDKEKQKIIQQHIDKINQSNSGKKASVNRWERLS